MTTPTESDERDRVMRIIQARCPELTDADLEALAHADTASIEAVLPDEIGERIMDAIAALEEKLDQLVAAIGDALQSSGCAVGSRWKRRQRIHNNEGTSIR